MADEPRRSVRATKGQHPKAHVLDQSTGPKKKSSKKGAKKVVEQEEEPEVIRCVCGAIETGDDEGEPWIACDNCGVWQHNVCVGVSPYAEDTPDNYLCEQCDPEFHKALLEGIERGEMLWDERRNAHEKEKAEEEQKGSAKKGGKKKGGKRSSELKVEIPKNALSKAKSPSLPADGKKDKEVPARAGSTKRKARENSPGKGTVKEPATKIRKVSAVPTATQGTTPPSGLTVKIIDLDTVRQGPAKLLAKGLQYSIPIAIKNGIYTLKPDDTVESKAERLAIEVEDAVFKTHPDKLLYNKQARALFNNLKQNQELCNGLLSLSLAPSTIAVMTSDDMASKALKKEMGEMKARADKQAIMVTDDGPRMRRTHKGDEVIEGDNFTVPNDIPMAISRRRSTFDPNGDMANRSKENSPANEVEMPQIIHNYRDHPHAKQPPLSVETKTSQPPIRKASGQAEFDINKVFSSVQSPTGPKGVQHVRRQSSNDVPPLSGPGADPEIDKLLQDDDGVESPPYSPAEYSSDPDIIWRGIIAMDSVAKFPAVAKHIGGADLSSKIPWNNLIQKELRVAGRIDTEKANEYLCSLRYSPPTDVVVVAVTPTGEAAARGFQDMFEYFHSKNRYGVLANKAVGNIRDTYLIPVPPSPAKLPDFLTNLEGQKVPESRSEPSILVALIVRNEWQPNPANFDGSAEVQSPTTMGHPQRAMSISGTGPAMSPIAPQGPFMPSTPQPLQSHDEAQRRHEQQQREGEANAVRILGHHINAPTVAFLMPQAFQMRLVEWEVIRDILERDPKARQDLQYLSQVLEVRMAQEN